MFWQRSSMAADAGWAQFTMSLNGEKFQQLIPILIVTNFSHVDRIHFHTVIMQKTWLACQGYFSEDNPSVIDGAIGRAVDIAERKIIVAASNEFRFFGKTASNFLSCENILSMMLRYDFH